MEPPKSPSKMKTKLDRISNLPCNVMEQIFSRLSIREVVRTSVLSSKWRYKSAMLPCLVFDDECVSAQKRTTFANIVDQVLLLHICPIRTFKLCYYDDLLATSDIDRWILYLSRNTIKEFTLEILAGDRYKMPTCFYSCQDMVHLDLYSCLLKPPSTFKGFGCLKRLCMQDVYLSQDVFENLIVCCPLLERLNLINCDGFTHLKIDARNLHTLDVDQCVFKKVTLENTLNLDVVCIDLDVHIDKIRVPSSSSNLVQFFVHLPRVRQLHIHSNFLKYLAAGDLPGKLPTPCLCLELISITIRFNEPVEILTALCLLRSSPALRVLEISVREKDQAVVGEVNSWLDDNQNFLLTELERIKITGISGIKDELDFIGFLLLNSPELERMTVKPASVDSSSELLKMLLRFRRSSPDAEIIYLDP